MKDKIIEILENSFEYSTYRSVEDKAFNKICKKTATQILKLINNKTQSPVNNTQSRLKTHKIK